MNHLYQHIAILAHAVVMAASLGVVIFVTLRRHMIRRTMRQPLIAYWLVVSVNLFSALVNLLHLGYLLSPMQGDGPIGWLDLAVEYPVVVAQSLITGALINLKVGARANTLRRRILAIGAHPDDIEIACGGTLALMRDSGYTVRGLVLTQGEKGGNGQVRPTEAKNGAKFLGLDQVEVLDLPDTHLQEHSLEVLAAIEKTIVEFNPDMILTHSAHDLHQDHRAAHEATLQAARNHGMVLCYESPSVTQEFVPTFFVDIGDYVAVKIESVKEHADQQGKPYMRAERVKGTAIFRGAQAKTRYAEGFEVVRVLFSAMAMEGHPSPQPRRQPIPVSHPGQILSPVLPQLSRESIESRFLLHVHVGVEASAGTA